MASWDPQQYERFAEERARPFRELVARIPTTSAVAVVDLGCGPGTMTATLAERWPDAAVLGLDSSPAMIEAAARLATPQLRFQLADAGAWRPQRGSVDVIVANASLQWVPDHETLLPRWAAALDDGGTLAFQVPVSTSDRSRPPADGVSTPRPVSAEMFAEVAAAGPWAATLAGATDATGPRSASPVLPATEYVRLLSAAGLTVDAWETTYYHVLPGDDPVYEWFKGTGLRPYLDALAGADLEAFTSRMRQYLRQRYPREPFGTVLPFPRLFVVAHRA
ncbi:methyltransferase domain-containing protein [Dactylosporangium matsuzakiense]|uniref:Trans-aconitate 2-methyltransferase n=1 Tax=Dactylosporangium matsuzakiense TaxID=53360 RepID=A0A9W6KH50_9ACTN|nr:methyltransferase domain-containing protein [Dactylosporangium matsuzakiense]UWZ46045.1 methyltransferase domain-containing protein [Dactylosporangium matsuzakiense]GLL00171.1 trans-aconitate 2-methyltransferase [Dactylosporangium matsuzakiense]